MSRLSETLRPRSAARHTPAATPTHAGRPGDGSGGRRVARRANAAGLVAAATHAGRPGESSDGRRAARRPHADDHAAAVFGGPSDSAASGGGFRPHRYAAGAGAAG